MRNSRMKKILIFTLILTLLCTAFAFPVFAGEGEVTVNVYLEDKYEPTEIVSVQYKLDGQSLTKELTDVSSSIKKVGTFTLPEGARLVSVTTNGAEVYDFGGGDTSKKTTFSLYKGFFHKIYSKMAKGIRDTFIEEGRWKLFARGLGVTLGITSGALIIGIFLGFIIAIIRSTYDKTGRFKIANAICKVYLTVIRGTPVVVQLMIMYFIVLASVRNGIVPAILAFGINSGAYVAEIVRSGIMSIDKGQFEAGRSLGFSYAQTMIYIICPQAFKNILPALGNEFIALVKETSIAGYVAVVDITKAGDTVRSVTYAPFFPLIVVAIIYLVIVMVLTKLMNVIERKLRNSDH